ncbi:MAG: YggS family pyridoxal phosphate-dependent enzyme [Clostridiales Family XIII bacterium]|nr:YggS family pyridoxal phosphate-dependent enzyme [Clostridiales Family XIII bacterium]
MGIKENIADVRARIAAAASRSGRRAEDITLVCVTKTRTVSEIAEALKSDAFELGENRAQEFLDKYGNIQDIAEELSIKRNIKWNFIGHLQRNKVKYIIDKADLIHSVDGFKLAEEIDARAAGSGRSANVLIQLNAGGETQKSGVAISESGALAKEIGSRLPHIKLRGLMAVVPAVGDPEEARGYFREAKRAFDVLAKRYDGAGEGFDHLSMGMTHDFEVAIEEGATMVRVGAAIFGPRSYETEDV